MLFPQRHLNHRGGLRIPAGHGLRLLAACAVLLATAAGADEGKSDAFTAAATNAGTAAQEFKNKTKGFSVRAQPWRGVLGKEKGKAVRIQLFKGNKYRFFIAVGRDVAGQGVAPAAQIVDADFNRLAESGKAKNGVAVVEFSPDATAMYMVLIRADSTDKSPDEFAAAMVYGFE